MIHLEQFQTVLKAILSGNGKEIVSIEVSVEKLPDLAKSIADLLEAGDWIFLDGDLGSGKTALTSDISKSLGSKNISTSPTFSLIQTENISSHPAIKKIVHLDLYRIKSNEELLYLGLENEFSKKDSIVLMEWPYQIDDDGFKNFFNVTNCQKPKRVLEISIELAENSRVYIFRKTSLGEANAI